MTGWSSARGLPAGPATMLAAALSPGMHPVNPHAMELAKARFFIEDRIKRLRVALAAAAVAVTVTVA